LGGIRWIRVNIIHFFPQNMGFESWSGLSDSVEIRFWNSRMDIWTIQRLVNWVSSINSMLGSCLRGENCSTHFWHFDWQSHWFKWRAAKGSLKYIWSTWSLLSSDVYDWKHLCARECFARPSSNASWPRTLVFECSLHATFKKKWTPLAGRWWKMPIAICLDLLSWWLCRDSTMRITIFRHHLGEYVLIVPTTEQANPNLSRQSCWRWKFAQQHFLILCIGWI